MKILSAAQMGEVDRLSSEIYRIPSLLLMENAGRSVADELEKSVPRFKNKKIHIVCGKGNNGGDGFVVARYLHLRGAQPQVILLAHPDNLKGDALTNCNIIRSLGCSLYTLPESRDVKSWFKRASAPDIVVDALFGTGLSKPVGREFKPAVDWINASRSSSFVASVDIPSGLFADSAKIPGPAVKADLTVTFTALKLALVSHPAAGNGGRVTVADIGSPSCLLENPEYRLNLVDPAQVQKALPARVRDSHKGIFGHVYVVAGSRGKSGAALMTGMAALRSGAGLVTLWLAESLHRDVVGKFPELMTEFLPETPEGTIDSGAAEKVLPSLSQADAVVIGPGITTHNATRAAVRELVRRSPVPVVLDADGINAYASHPEDLLNENGQVVVITPHPGEMGRLIGKTAVGVQNDRLGIAREFAASRRCFVILKGHQTIIATPAGQMFINSTGNPGMATGGSGDILAGMVGRFVAGWRRKYRGADLPPLSDYLSAAVYLHGLAGDLAAVEKGEESLIATDLIPYLPAAFKTVKGC